MQSIIIHRVATAAVMPLVAASGFAGYSYYQNPNQYQQNQYQQMACTQLSNDLTYSSGNQYYNNQNDLLLLQRFLLARGYLRGNANGYFDQATFTAVGRFQADNGLPVTGVVDTQTRSLIQQMSCNDQNTNGQNNNGGYQNTNGQLSIQGIDAPRSLAVGQSGTWSVHVLGWTNYQGGGALHYSVVWGDENNGVRTANAYYPSTSVGSSGTFTHVYTRTGTFTPVFTVTDDYGHSTQVSATTYVSGSGYNQGGNQGTSGSGGNDYCSTNAGWYDRSCHQSSNGNQGTYNGSLQGGTDYCSTNAGWYDRTCHQQTTGGSQGTYNGGYQGGYNSGGYGNGVPAGCSSYYDRACYVNGQYVGPSYGSPTYNVPSGTSSNTGYSNGSTGYLNPLGGPHGVDYSCYYDRACLAQMKAQGSY